MKKNKMEEKMICIKAFDKGLICKGFQYKENTVFEIEYPEKVKMCEYGFHCVNGTDISKTVAYYYPTDDIEYCLVEVDENDIIDIRWDKLVCKKIKILNKIPKEELIDYDETGEWIYDAGLSWEKFDYEKGLSRLMEIDETGEWIHRTGCNWKEFDYEKGLSRLMEIDETGEWIDNTCWDWENGKFRRLNNN